MCKTLRECNVDNTTVQVLSDKVLNTDNDFWVKFQLQQLEENT